MYGVKRIEYDENRQIRAIEFYPETYSQDITKTMVTLGLLRNAKEAPAPIPETGIQDFHVDIPETN